MTSRSLICWIAAVRALTAPRRALSRALSALVWGPWARPGRGRPARRGSGVGVQRVGFALAAPRGAVGPVDLYHLDAVGLQRLGESRAVAAVPSTPAIEHRPEASRPGDRGVVAGRVGEELGIAEELAGVGDGREVDGVEVGVDADDDAPWLMSRWWCPFSW